MVVQTPFRTAAQVSTLLPYTPSLPFRREASRDGHSVVMDGGSDDRGTVISVVLRNLDMWVCCVRVADGSLMTLQCGWVIGRKNERRVADEAKLARSSSTVGKRSWPTSAIGNLSPFQTSGSCFRALSLDLMWFPYY